MTLLAGIIFFLLVFILGYITGYFTACERDFMPRLDRLLTSLERLVDIVKPKV